jgi:EmrB/QacA subfamily drug resistance transporter
VNPATLSRSRRRLVLAICCLSLLMVTLDVTVLNVALPALERDLGASIAGVQWTIDAYAIVIASLLLLSGSTADRVGRRRTFQVGLLVFSAGSLLCSLAPGLGWLIAFRMLQAVGGSMLNPVALSIIVNTMLDPSERARAIGVWSGVVGISMAAGPLVGGALVDSIGWRAIFWMNVPIGLVAIVLTALFVPESRAAHARRFDPVGQLLVIGFLAFLVYAIIEAPSEGWGSPEILGCLAVSFASVVGLVLYERRRTEPLLDLRFFRSAPFSGASVIAVSAFTAMGGFLFLNALYLQDVLGYSALRAGLFLLPMAGAMLVLGPISGRIVASRGPRIPLIGGAAAIILSGMLFALAGSDLPTDRLLVGYALIGCGFGLANAAITNTAVSGMPRSQAGVASAITSMTRQVGLSLGVAVIGSVIASHVAVVEAGPAFTEAAHVCWWIIAGCGVAVLAVALTTTGRWGRETARQASALIEAQSAAPLGSGI